MDLNLALNKYAQDNAEKHGQVIRGVLDEEIDMWLPWTSSTWEDGVPVTKYFRRCQDKQHLILPVGTKLEGVFHEGWETGCPVYTFYLNGTWYSAKEEEADEIMENLVIEK